MKKILMLTVLLISVFMVNDSMAGEKSGLSKADMERLAGEWYGPLNPPNGNFIIIFKFEIKEDGEFKAILDIPGQGFTGILFTEVEMVDGNLTLRIPAVEAEYKGKITGDEITGEWKWNGEHNLTLVRGAEEGDEESSARICTIQATVAKYDGWYLDFENSREPEKVDGEKSSRNLLLSKELLPGAYWKIVSTNEQSDTGDR